jgi:hypothetical protein
VSGFRFQYDATNIQLICMTYPQGGVKVVLGHKPETHTKNNHRSGFCISTADCM